MERKQGERGVGGGWGRGSCSSPLTSDQRRGLRRRREIRGEKCSDLLKLVLVEGGMRTGP